jgi:hypothetical protein
VPFSDFNNATSNARATASAALMLAIFDAEDVRPNAVIVALQRPLLNSRDRLVHCLVTARHLALAGILEPKGFHQIMLVRILHQCHSIVGHLLPFLRVCSAIHREAPMAIFSYAAF